MDYQHGQFSEIHVVTPVSSSLPGHPEQPPEITDNS